MNADEHRLVFVDLSHDERDVLFAGDVTLVRVHAEIAVRSRQTRRCQTAHVLLVLHPVVDDVGDGDDVQAVTSAKLAEIRQPGHRSVFVHDFADHRGGTHAGDRSEIDRGFSLTGALQHAAFARAQWKNVAWAQKVLRPRLRIDRHAHSFTTVTRGNAGGHASPGLDRDCERRAVRRSVVLDHQRQIEVAAPLLGQREANESAPMLRHEVDRLRGDLLGRDAKVSLILAVLVIDNDDELPATIKFCSFFD